MRRRILVLSALVAVIALAIGSAGFSSTSADRGVSVDTASDANAYLSLQYSNEPISRTSDETVTKTFVTVENQLTESLDVTVEYTVTEPDGSSSSGSDSRTVGTGDTFDVDASFTCDADGAYTVTFDVTAQSDSLSVDTTTGRTVTYDTTCE